MRVVFGSSGERKAALDEDKPAAGHQKRKKAKPKKLVQPFDEDMKPSPLSPSSDGASLLFSGVPLLLPLTSDAKFFVWDAGAIARRPGHTKKAVHAENRSVKGKNEPRGGFIAGTGLVQAVPRTNRGTR